MYKKLYTQQLALIVMKYKNMKQTSKILAIGILIAGNNIFAGYRSLLKNKGKRRIIRTKL